MNIQLKKLTLTNFKGIRSLEIPFSKETTISGRNASGKTTIADSFAWILFGKNSQDKKDFEVKTLDENNQPIHKLDHEVEAVLDVDGMATTIKRSFREKWVKPKGQSEEVLGGHETILSWNHAPVSQADFNVKISSLCSEEIFKLITNPLAFNTMEFKKKGIPDWKVRRNILFDVVGDESVPSDEEIANGNKSFEELMELLSGKSFDEFRREVKAKIKKIKDEQILIPARIDEANRSLPDPVDTASIEKEIAGLNTEIEKIESEIADRSKANESVLKEREEKQKQIYAIRAKIVEFEDSDARKQREAGRDAENKREEVKSEKERLERELKSIQDKITNNKGEIIALEGETASLRKRWSELNEKEVTFEEGIVACPTCHREYPSDDVEAKKEELRANFNTDKQKKLEEISAKGKVKKARMDKLKAENEELNEQQESKKILIDAAIEAFGSIEGPKEFQLNPEIPKLRDQIKTIQDELDAPQQEINSDLTSKRTEIRTQIDSLKAKLLVKDQIERGNTRIKELEGHAKIMGQEVADLERMEFTMAEFTKKKIETIEDKINAKFSVVRWKLYSQLINGGEEETCVALVNGVPFPDVNTAGQINAGLDIINALSEHYEVSAPIFVDHSESVNQLHPTDSQVIRLVVTEDEKLTVKNGH